ncbi:MAG TPA: hypothetical protein VFS95_05970 [Telluria sp.]|nr:hypothetical protein [Telluria sp.]
MNKFMFLCALLFSPLAGAAGPTFGQHGMALFGGSGGLYASHLPMFHPPHDYQVVLKLRISDKSLDDQLRRQLGSTVALWTLSPEEFDLDRLAPGSKQPLTRFKADIVQGHFEQGGTTRHAAATVIVEKVLMFRKLSATLAKSGSARYLQIGSGSERFLLKEIDSRPDFDHIVAVSTRADAPLEPLMLSKTSLAEPSARMLSDALPGSKVRGTVYFSTEDLK